ncbi:MAG: thioredoxin family protein [Bacteroidales bacterium]|nr:thioredoxin family protein [Bacteroidales bacterium]MBN2820541.1 thioredoxin family protein [Bacteroidales bacterium]
MKTLLLITLGIMMSAPDFISGYKVGDTARDFSLKNVDDKMVSLSDYDNAKGFVVIFTCNHCPFSKAYEDRIIALDKKYKTKGYPVVAINSNDAEIVPEDSYQKMIERANEKDFSFPYLYDETQEIADTYGATNTPHIFLLNKENNKLVVKYIGAIDNNYQDASAVTEHYLSDAINALIAGKNPEKDFTKAIGCSIKRK